MTDPIPRLNAALDGRYRIERELGEGGMATVYLTRDLKHNRNVALKILKPELAAVVGAERFLAEIETTANLQHPHILPLFDSGQADGFLFYVMPYVEGDTLRDKIDREKQLGIEEGLRIVEKVASALDHAHKQGVVHRDIKPANILLSADGEPTVADFGIALAVAQAGGGRVTETGLSVGTPHYMSPEQATGDRDVDPRTDVYALGCVLYEMLIGEPPYTGSTAQAILGKIIQGHAISATEARSTIPPNVDAAIRKALEKLPADRFMTASDFAKALGDPGFRHGDETSTGVGASGGPWKGLSIATSALALVLAVSLGWALLRPSPPRPASRQALSGEGWFDSAPFGLFAALAPDGSSMILPVGTGPEDVQLGLKLRGSTEVTPIPGSQGGQSPTYSPDGQWVAFRVGTDLFKRPLVGGSPVRLAEDVAPGNHPALAWLDDGTILYEQRPSEPEPGLAPTGLVQIPEDGGEPSVVFWASRDGGSPTWAHGLPGGQSALVVVELDAVGTQLHAVSLQDRSSEPILDDVTNAWYVPTGHLVYLQDGALFAALFDVDALEIAGGPVPLFDGVALSVPGGLGGWGNIRIGEDGTMLYQAGGVTAPTSELVLVDREGQEEPLGFGPGRFSFPRFSPDGGRLAVADGDGGDNRDLWVFDLARGSQTRATFGGRNIWPVWTPDGDRLTYTEEPANAIVTAAADGSARVDTLLAPGGLKFPTAWTPDGLELAFYESDGAADRDLWVLPQGGEPEPILVTPFNERSPVFSPDGRWLAYISNRSGQDEIYVRPYPGPGTEVTVSTGGGSEPVWSPDGTELFYRTGDQFMVVAVDRTVGFSVGPPRALFAGPYPRETNYANYDIAPDGQHFVVPGPLVSGTEVVVTLAQDWFTELCERTGDC